MRTGILVMALLAGGAGPEVFHATLTPGAEVPPTTGDGRGAATVTVDTATGAATYDVSFTKLSGPATMAHIHGPAAAGANAGVVVVLGGMPPASPVHGTATLTPDQVRDLEAGKYYVNVHTAANPKGEIRGQLAR